MIAAVMQSDAPVLPRYGLFAGFLAFAGLPIYIHAPKFFVDEYGVGLAAIGGALLVLRLFDFLRDPLLGRLVKLFAIGILVGPPVEEV